VAADAEHHFTPGTRLGRYEVIELLGEGGMGTVYRARDTELARQVALKRIAVERPGRSGRQSIEESRVRLRREAQAMARIDHPGVVRIYDAGIEEGQLYVAMELVAGGTLVDWLNERKRSWREVVKVMVAAGRGLAAAHSAGLVHRDIKPGNILVDEHGVAKVTDFGLARSPGEMVEVPEPTGELLSFTITRTGTIAGTPAYMAPEQLAGEQVDARADQFSFCVALWEALCGSRPFAEGGTIELRGRQSSGLRAVSELGDRLDVPRRLLALVRRGLATDPAARWLSMGDLLDALERAARPPLALRGLVALGALATTAVLLTGGVSFSERGQGRVPAVQPPVAIKQHPNAQPLTFTLLKDGRYLQIEEESLLVKSADLQQTLQLPVPDGWRPIGARAASLAGRVMVYTARTADAEGCRWWLAPVDGGGWEPVEDDPGCARRVAFDISPDGKRVVHAGPNGLVVRPWKGSKATKNRLFGHPIDESIPVWSPDGQRVAIAIDRSVNVFNTGDGLSYVLEPASSKPQWLDADRLLYAVRLSTHRSEVRMFDLRTTKQSLVFEVEGQIKEISVTPDGVLLMKQSVAIGIYAAELAALHPRWVSQLTPVQTGAELDFEPTAWAPDGGLLSTGVSGGRRSLIKTMPGARGEPVVQYSVDAFLNGPTSMGRILYGTGSEGQYKLWIYDVANGVHRFWREDASIDLLSLSCALSAPRCYQPEEPNLWFDPVAIAHERGAPSIVLHEMLSPDGKETARVDGNVVILRDLHSNAETKVALSPAINGRMEVSWGADSETLLVRTSPPEQDSQAWGHHRLLLMNRAGQWRPLVEGGNHTIRELVPSPDGARVAFSAQRTETTWELRRFGRASR
jgi:WD40 repeat protein